MKRCRLVHSAFVAVALTALQAGEASAHLGDMVFPIYELPTSDLPDLHDGTLEDWEEVLPAASLDQHYFVSYGGLGGIDPSSLAWRVFLAWHGASQRIYMAIERLDDVFILGEGTNLSVDGDHSGGQYAIFEGVSEEQRKRLEYSQAQMYNARPESRDGLLLHTRAPGAWEGAPPWADAGGFQHGESPNQSVVEFAVTAWDDLNWEGPELSRRSALEAGKIIGFHIDVEDSDRESFCSGWFKLAIPEVVGHGQSGDMTFSHFMFADNFVDGQLIPCHRGDCSGATTGVSRDSWGCIKASFKHRTYPVSR